VAFPILDPARCTACHDCERACVVAHYGPDPDTATVLERRRLAITLVADLPTLHVCTDCAPAPCVPVCPHLALLRFPDGRVDLREDRCTGCGTCVSVCPERGIRRVYALDLAVKCDGCRPLGIAPACVQACPTSALSVSPETHPDGRT
jgi:electron transport protein HydN